MIIYSTIIWDCWCSQWWNKHMLYCRVAGKSRKTKRFLTTWAIRLIICWQYSRSPWTSSRAEYTSTIALALARSRNLLAFRNLRLSEKIRWFCMGNGKPLVGVEDKSRLMVSGFLSYVNTKRKDFEISPTCILCDTV